jgi:hypothetical protein
MSHRRSKFFSLIFVALVALLILVFATNPPKQKASSSWSPNIPASWDVEALNSLELPLVVPEVSPVFVSPDYYYRVPVRPIYKTYPVYTPAKEPPGYIEWLKKQEPQIIFDPSKLNSEEDWIKAGALVFHSPIAYEVIVTESDVKNKDWYEKINPPIGKDGAMHFIRYGIREKGKVEVGILACATCHTRLMPDGTLVDGAQGNFAYNRAIAWSYRQRQTLDFVRNDIRLMYGTPWLRPDPHLKLQQGTMDEICSYEEAIPPGVVARNGTSPLYPTGVPNLIGIKEIRYLDATGLVRHRSIGDLMRYMALAQGMDFVSRYASFIPRGEGDPPVLPDPHTFEAKRYSDEQLYALALYVYSLKPPPNPNKFDALAAKGQRVFMRERCGACHTPPLYTNNKLTPVDSFEVPEEHYKKYGVTPLSVGTDPGLSIKTRRGTGYYKVPSLQGLWSRLTFGHSGDVATLEDWFDPRRTNNSYIPTAFKGFGVRSRAVKGHRYGLDLSKEDRRALIAFLKTL